MPPSESALIEGNFTTIQAVHGAISILTQVTFIGTSFSSELEVILSGEFVGKTI
jgi:hypothetical protein